MTITKLEARRILGRLTDNEIDDWKALLRNPVGFHQVHGMWMEPAEIADEVGECCLTVLARRVGGLSINDDGEYDDGEEVLEWHDDVAGSAVEGTWGMNLDPFIGRNDNVAQLLGDDPANYKSHDDSFKETRPWTYAEIADYLDQLQEARRG